MNRAGSAQAVRFPLWRRSVTFLREDYRIPRHVAKELAALRRAVGAKYSESFLRAAGRDRDLQEYVDNGGLREQLQDPVNAEVSPDAFYDFNRRPGVKDRGQIVVTDGVLDLVREGHYEVIDQLGLTPAVIGGEVRREVVVPGSETAPRELHSVDVRFGTQFLVFDAQARWAEKNEMLRTEFGLSDEMVALAMHGGLAGRVGTNHFSLGFLRELAGNEQLRQAFREVVGLLDRSALSAETLSEVNRRSGVPLKILPTMDGGIRKIFLASEYTRDGEDPGDSRLI
ncbi:hypothetical protein ACFL5U_03140 [Candidatus Margulisiibacteriota bacterium]